MRKYRTHLDGAPVHEPPGAAATLRLQQMTTKLGTGRTGAGKRGVPAVAAAQSASGLAGFLDLCGLVLTGPRVDSGPMLSGRPAAIGLTSDWGSDRKNTRQPGESWDLFLIMQTVTRSTSGISALQRRNASPLQARSSSGV
jgi:hypothetical protein